MSITFDNSELKQALDQFDINEEDYYILFTGNIVYIVWCAHGKDVLAHARKNDCVSVEIKGEWFYSQELHDFFEPPHWVCARYILATN